MSEFRPYTVQIAIPPHLMDKFIAAGLLRQDQRKDHNAIVDAMRLCIERHLRLPPGASSLVPLPGPGE
jgi:hypothetical protein